MRKAFIKLGHKPRGVMNKTEMMYAEKLNDMKYLGEIKSYAYEKLKLRIGDKCWYTPDFMVIDSDDQLKMIEVKGGFYTDDAMVKWKAVCTLYPFIKFIMVQYKNKQWKVIGEN